MFSRCTWLSCAVLVAIPAFAQRQTSELRLSVQDAVGLAVPATAQLASFGTETRLNVTVHHDGTYAFKNVPFGTYELTVTYPGFQPLKRLVELRTELPVNLTMVLSVAPIESSIEVRENLTLLNPDQPGAVQHIGANAIADRTSNLAGRGLLDLVASQPGWLLEANGVLHPRGSEYDTQYVVNGFPVQDNRSPAFAPSFEADDVEAVRVLTGGYPAEFGKKLGGVIEVTTQRNSAPGLRSTLVLQGGSFSTLSGFLSSQYTRRKTTLNVSAEGFVSDRYLDPPVQDNFTNHASNSAFTGSWVRDLSDHDRMDVSINRRRTLFQVPDEKLQDAAGQRQDRASQETVGHVAYQHVFSPSMLGSLGGMVRDVSAQLWSNPRATPISAAQDRGFRESYLRGALTWHERRNEWKAGVETSFADIHEVFDYRIVAFRIGGTRIFDRSTPPQLAISDRRQDREQSAFLQDVLRLGGFALSIGVRYDHYRLLVDDQAWSPRLAASWYWRRSKLVLRASYDRTFGTPAIENILVSASPLAAGISRGGFYIPVRPSHGNFLETGFSKSLFDKLRLDGSYFRRGIRNFADDDVLLNTGVSFPIAFDRAAIHGLEAKVEVPRWGRFSGFGSYSWMAGLGQLPIAGGLFLDPSAADLLASHDKFPITQDQRQTARARTRYEISSRLWVAAGASFGSGLPVQLADGQSMQFLVAQYGQAVVDRVNFDRGRVRPSFSLDASAGAELWRKDKVTVRAQADCFNLTGRVNVINFAGLLSGTAIGPPRSFGVRLRAEF